MNLENYKFIEPAFGYVLLKKVKEEKGVLVQGNLEQNRAYAYVVNLPRVMLRSWLAAGDLVVYEELEGQELYLSDKVKEEGIILIQEKKIIAKIL